MAEARRPGPRSNLPSIPVGTAAAVQDHGRQSNTAAGGAMPAIDDRIRTGPLLILVGARGTELQHRAILWTGNRLET